MLGKEQGKGGWGNGLKNLPALLQFGFYSMVHGVLVWIFNQGKPYQNGKSERVV